MAGRERTLAVDVHVHTEASYDGHASVEDVLTWGRAAGLDGLVVTDHDTIEASRRAAALAPAYDLFAVPGVEVSTADGHLLALGVDDCPAPHQSIERTVETVREAGGVAVVPHPFQYCRHGVRRRRLARVADAVAGIETFNACTVLNVRNAQARRYADRNGVPAFGGSDAHSAPLVGRGYTEVRVDTDVGSPSSIPPEVVLDALRSGRTAARGRRTSLRTFVRKYATNARLRASGSVR